MKKYQLITLLLLPILLICWEQIGPAGIKARNIIVDEATGKIYVLSFDFKYLYKVEEATNEWEEVNVPRAHVPINSFDVYNDTIFVTKEGFVFKSEDGGLTWNSQDFQIGCYKIFILKNYSNIVFLQRYGNVWFRSTDNGSSWSESGEIWGDVILYNQSNSRIYIIAGNALFVSNDLGETWNQDYLPFENIGLIPISGVVIDESTMIVTGVNMYNSIETIFISYNNGESWENINYGYELEMLGNSITYIWNEIIISTVKSVYFMNNSPGLYRLNQTEETWEKIGDGLSSYLVGPEIYSSNDNLYWSSLYDGVLIFEEDYDYTRLETENIYRREIFNLGFIEDNPASLYTFHGSLHIYNDNLEWERIDEAYCTKSIIQNSNGWLATRMDGVYYSNQLDTNWVPSMNGIDESDKNNVSRLYSIDESILSYGVDYSNNESFFYLSTDFGQTWSKTLTGNENYDSSSLQLGNVISFEDFYIGAFIRKGIYVTMDSGLTWNPFYAFNEPHLYLNLYENHEMIYLLAQNLNNGDFILYRTEDFEEWHNCNNFDYQEKVITDIAFHPNESSVIFASIRSYDIYNPAPNPPIMISNDNGNTWQEYYIDGLDQTANIRKVYTCAETNQLYILPIENSILRCNLDEISTNENKVLPFAVFNLSNHPNPFNPETTISFILPQSSPTELSIYNLKGQKVQTLVNDILPAGEHQIIWNGMDSQNKRAASGLYLYQMKTEFESVTNKMMLLK